jgi:hypothetical protein
MVAYNPRLPDDERPSLPPEIAAQLHAALLARWNGSDAYDSMLESALTAAARDAKARGLRAEELLLALKKIEQDVADALDVADTQDRDRFRIWLVAACMRAFFAPDRSTDG